MIIIVVVVRKILEVQVKQVTNVSHVPTICRRSRLVATSFYHFVTEASAIDLPKVAT